jgi:hypothetical protein
MVLLWTWLVLVLNLPFRNVSDNRSKIELNLLVCRICPGQPPASYSCNPTLLLSAMTIHSVGPSSSFLHCSSYFCLSSFVFNYFSPVLLLLYFEEVFCIVVLLIVFHAIFCPSAALALGFTSKLVGFTSKSLSSVETLSGFSSLDYFGADHAAAASISVIMSL